MFTYGNDNIIVTTNLNALVTALWRHKRRCYRIEMNDSQHRYVTYWVLMLWFCEVRGMTLRLHAVKFTQTLTWCVCSVGLEVHTNHLFTNIRATLGKILPRRIVGWSAKLFAIIMNRSDELGSFMNNGYRAGTRTDKYIYCCVKPRWKNIF